MDRSEAPSDRKRALRQTVRRRRAQRDGEVRRREESDLAAAALALPAIRAASCVAVYASLPDEPATGLLREGLRELGVRVLLPVVVDDAGGGSGTAGGGPTLEWALDVGDLAANGVLKLFEPTGERLGPDAIAQADVLLIPAMAVDTTGLRMGRGRGYYDAALGRLAVLRPDALVLAVVHDDELLDASATPVPAEAHDRRVDGVLTPARTVFF
ncbi:5-formyltetrahydrofolate cyclo-ligase [Kineosporia sp. J2-2]|uniref:5-formyltetrahydrofolate cyclo-ligase n=1 Tax=Kineosporia corallincola TaxID=2835133 RepID=A0ABS5TJW8_9ACTN|nr:5-formyltetrahydrofolate cyclo-ligase [Kineosporia corallincola]MBT0770684.1 5-formyltetrahydrofolate cyclo-ligase [Kineosporia corallincola]